MKQIIKRIMLALLLLAGLMNVQQVYANDDYDDDYEDDGGYWDGWDVDDFSEYIWSGEAAEDGIDGNVWYDPIDFIENADDDVLDDVIESLEILESSTGTPAGQASNSGSTSTIYQQSTTDVISQQSVLNQPLSTQVKSGCGTATLEFINHVFGGSINEGTYLLEYYQATGVFLTNTQGMYPQEMISLIDKYFTTSSFGNIKDAIDNGAIMVTTMNNETHIVGVVGYTDSGELIYKDPSETELQVAPPSNFNFDNYSVGITGIK